MPLITGTNNGETLTGTSGDDQIEGLGGDDILIGAGGNDMTDGGEGNDQHFVESPGDIVVERAGEGDDDVITSVSYALGDGTWVETLRTSNAAGTIALSLIGNEVSNSIYGNAGDNVLNGGGGNDYLVALEGSDYLIGGTGSDVLMGGLGNDTYDADFSAVEGQDSDVILENPGEGDDILGSRGDFVLRAGLSIETLVALGSAPVSLSGNEIGNSIYGNDANNVLAGGDGSDYLVGGGGDDRLHGDSGFDTMQGGTGDDRYFVDNVADQIIELPGEGSDSVLVSNSYFRLAPGMEVETIRPINESSFQALTFIGNEFANTIFGNNGINYIYGNGGADILIGQQGDDYYYLSDPATQIVEGHVPGYDRVFTSTDYVLASDAIVELLSTYWQYGDEPIDITGNEVSQTLIGNYGPNVLDGKLGENVLLGLGGSDTFAFTVLGGPTTILDFEPGIDTIALSQAIFDALPMGDLDPEALAFGFAATEPDDRILYDPTTGFLRYDPDGSGEVPPEYFATLAGAPQLSATDFAII